MDIGKLFKNKDSQISQQYSERKKQITEKPDSVCGKKKSEAAVGSLQYSVNNQHKMAKS